MRSSLPAVLAHIKTHEGGYVNNLSDPGGATNWGITLDTYRARGNPEATELDLRRMTWKEAIKIYKADYWKWVRGDDLPKGVDLVVMDHAVNAGPINAIRLLQRAVGTAEDGRIGPVTLDATRTQPAQELIRAYTKARLGYYRSLRHWKTFGAGWTKRAQAAEARALALCNASAGELNEQNS